MSNKEMPILLLTGYLGSGKTTLVNRILKNEKGIRFAVIVNDIGEVNIDATLIQQGGMVGKKDDSLVALQNGCICCTLKTDLMQQIVEIMKMDKFDYIVIEASGICEPEPIAQTITSMKAIGGVYTEFGTPRLDCIVTVVDALRMVDEFGCGENLERKDLEEEDIENLIIQQIEFCNMVLLNKVADVETEALEKVKRIIREIQLKAKIVECNYADVDIESLLNTNIFDFRQTESGAGWLRGLEGDVHEEHEHHHDDEDENHDHDEHGHGHSHEDEDHEDGHEHGHGHEDEEHDHEHSHEHGHSHEDEDEDHEDGHEHGHEDEDHDHEHSHEHGHSHEDEDEDHEDGHEHGHGQDHEHKNEEGHHHEHEGHHHHHHHDHEGGEVEEYGIGTFVYYRRPAFDINKFDWFISKRLPKSVIRAKGLCYFSNNTDMSCLFEQAGKQISLREVGRWFATAPEEELIQMMRQDPTIMKDWDAHYGDRMQKIVFIGQNMDKEQICRDLDTCLDE